MGGPLDVRPGGQFAPETLLDKPATGPTHLYRHYGLDAPGILARIGAVTAGRG